MQLTPPAAIPAKLKERIETICTKTRAVKRELEN